MKQYIKFFLMAALVACLSGCANENSDEEANIAENAHETDHGEVHSNGARPEKLELPEHLLTMLRQEMQQIDSGMGILLSALAQGNAEESVQVAEHLHNTFILKQRLSQQDLKQLISLLPAEFVNLDRAFHGNAKKIAEAVKEKNFEAAVNLYSEMAQACVTCHKQYALTRYPNLNHK